MMSHRFPLLRVCTALLLAPAAAPQNFVFAPEQIPQGVPENNSSTENIDFADVDLDGDMDAVNADGSDFGNDQNRLWINLGFAQGGTIGFFGDRTSERFPAVLDSTRDMDFGDYDNDGDDDLLISNHSSISPQSNRFWTNVGNLQGGAAGFFTDETLTRWQGLGVNNQTSQCSSLPANQVLPSGGFFDWSWDSLFGDLDNDGDLDLVHSSYGPMFQGDAPHRVFFNDGTGQFTEYNPSCVQFTGPTIGNGSPALWAQGFHQNNTLDTGGLFADISGSTIGVELGDLDQDFDLDFLIGSRSHPPPRLFRNLKSEQNQLLWRDVTHSQLASALPTGQDNYEQEFGDMDGDGDYDLYGLNWPGLSDAVYANNGLGTFGSGTTLVASGSDDEEGDWFDYNNDGHLDIFVGNFSGQEKLYQGNGAGSFGLVQLPVDGSTTRGLDSCDVDLDGDYDVLVANDAGQANVLLKNVTQVPDTRAANLPHLEQVPNRPAGPPPSIVRVHAYDNASWDVLRYNTTVLEYQVEGGAIVQTPMIYIGGQMFRGEIPGALVGQISYRARSTDEHGNLGVSPVKSYTAFITTCFGDVLTYCTSKVSSSGCVPAMGASGNPSFFAPQVFSIEASQVESAKNGLLLFGLTGPSSTPFLDGFLCVAPPLYRTKMSNSQGSGGCGGVLSYKLSQLMEHPLAGQSLVEGQQVHVQGWFRDPAAASMSGLTNGLQFVICP